LESTDRRELSATGFGDLLSEAKARRLVIGHLNTVKRATSRQAGASRAVGLANRNANRCTLAGNHRTIGTRRDRRENVQPGTPITGQFLEHASRGQILEELGLTADAVATSLASRRN
jgi:hypothetical protein